MEDVYADGRRHEPRFHLDLDDGTWLHLQTPSSTSSTGSSSDATSFPSAVENKLAMLRHGQRVEGKVIHSAPHSTSSEAGAGGPSSHAVVHDVSPIGASAAVPVPNSFQEDDDDVEGAAAPRMARRLGGTTVVSPAVAPSAPTPPAPVASYPKFLALIISVSRKLVS